MPAATLTSKGQLVVPKSIRDRMGLHPGDRLDFVAPKPLRATGHRKRKPSHSTIRNKMYGKTSMSPSFPVF